MTYNITYRATLIVTDTEEIDADSEEEALEQLESSIYFLGVRPGYEVEGYDIMGITVEEDEEEDDEIN